MSICLQIWAFSREQLGEKSLRSLVRSFTGCQELARREHPQMDWVWEDRPWTQHEDNQPGQVRRRRKGENRWQHLYPVCCLAGLQSPLEDGYRKRTILWVAEGDQERGDRVPLLPRSSRLVGALPNSDQKRLQPAQFNIPFFSELEGSCKMSTARESSARSPALQDD